MRKTKKNKKSKKLNKSWKNWSQLAPNKSQRKLMNKKCGKKCFLGPNLSFPICRKYTCKVDKRGILAAFIRAQYWNKTKKNKKYKNIIKKANLLLKKSKKKTGGGLFDLVGKLPEFFVAEAGYNMAHHFFKNQEQNQLLDKLRNSYNFLTEKSKIDFSILKTNPLSNTYNFNENSKEKIIQILQKFQKSYPNLKIENLDSVNSYMSLYNKCINEGITFEENDTLHKYVYLKNFLTSLISVQNQKINQEIMSDIKN